MRFTFIRAESANHTVSTLCRMLNVSRSGYYAWLEGDVSKRALRDAELGTAIVAVHEESRGTYGSPRVLEELRGRSFRTSRKRIARLMRECGLFGAPQKRWRHPPTSPDDQAFKRNVLARNFAPEAPNRAWAADITYVRTWEGWLYLAVVLDLYSRRVVGWSMKPHMRSELVLDALAMAVGQRIPGPGLVAHSDRGTQYTSHAYQRALRANEIVCSMSGRGNCWDNAVVESFFGTLNNRPLAHDRLARRADGRIALRLKTPYRDGTTHLLFDPVELVEKLAALVPRPKKNLVLYHGVLAGNAALRDCVVAYGREASRESTGPALTRTEGGPNVSWADLMRHAFGHDVLECPRCGCRLRFLASIESGPIARAILRHLGLLTEAESAARAPPPDGPEPSDYAIDPTFEFGP